MAALQNTLQSAAQSQFKPKKKTPMGLGGRVSFGMPPRPANFGVGVPSAPSVPYAPSNNAGAASLGAQAPGAASPDIRDPEYWLNTENIAQYYGTQKATLGAQATSDQLAYNRAMSLLGADPTTGAFKSGNYDGSGVQNAGSFYEDSRKTQESANKSGLFYSGILGRDLGALNSSYTNKVGSLTEENTGRTNLRNIALGDLESQYGPGGIKYREAINAAADRQMARDQQNQPMGSDPAATAASVGGTISQNYTLTAAQKAAIAAGLAKRQKQTGAKFSRI